MDPRRSIPAVDRLLASAAFAELAASTPHRLLTHAIQRVQDDVRAALASDVAYEKTPQTAEWYAERVSAALADLRASTLRPVINATGVVLHTNLGRAPLADAAIAAMTLAAGGYTALEYDVARGRRGSRYDHCARLLRQLAGAEDALVVNNNAAALVLMLNTFARGREAIVSRGELVEIGGSFRIPDIMQRSGAKLREVGSTNRTHPEDYVAAAGAKTGAVLKVHRSNFNIEGFTAEVDVAALAGIAGDAGVPLLYDMGSGLLDHADSLGLPDEPTATQAIADGATVVSLSGDKLIGGPQAGILLGTAAHIAAMRKNPLCRALRVDKLTLAALEATLLLHLDPAVARTAIPALRMLTLTAADLDVRAAAVAQALEARGCTADIVDGTSAVGGGAAPGRELPTRLLALRSSRSAAAIERRLRTHETPVVARIENGAVLIDLRTVAPVEEAILIDAVAAALAGTDGSELKTPAAVEPA
jgi:L-seryl-tRNA(Ser) seleniumtransferase